MEQSQLALPVDVPSEEIYRAVMRKSTLGASIELCAELAGFSLEKTARDHLANRGLSVDKGQFSRWKDGSEGVIWPKLSKVMDVFGNDAPLLWMNHQRGWDLYAMRRLQTETQKQLDEERKKRVAAEEKLTFLTQVMQGRVVTA